MFLSTQYPSSGTTNKMQRHWDDRTHLDNHIPSSLGRAQTLSEEILCMFQNKETVLLSLRHCDLPQQSCLEQSFASALCRIVTCWTCLVHNGETCGQHSEQAIEASKRQKECKNQLEQEKPWWKHGETPGPHHFNKEHIKHLIQIQRLLEKLCLWKLICLRYCNKQKPHSTSIHKFPWQVTSGRTRATPR